MGRSLIQTWGKDSGLFRSLSESKYDCSQLVLLQFAGTNGWRRSEVSSIALCVKDNSRKIQSSLL